MFNPKNWALQKKGLIQFGDLLAAYYLFRKNKHNTANAFAFEIDFESKLYKLWCQINDEIYQPYRSIAFVIYTTVAREIFAVDFKDRVVHHLITNKLNPLFDNLSMTATPGTMAKELT